jgi:hypothetical protein
MGERNEAPDPNIHEQLLDVVRGFIAAGGLPEDAAWSLRFLAVSLEDDPRFVASLRQQDGGHGE